MIEIANVAIFWAFLAGVVSFLSPCVLPLVPGYVSYIAGQSLDEVSERRFSRARMAAIGLSAGFVLGFTTVFMALGASATAIGQLFQAYRSQADIVAGAIIIIFGLHMTGLIRIAFLNRDTRFLEFGKGGTVYGAYVLGAAFAFGWTPCIGPILGAILTLSAATATVGDGVALLFVYSMGLAIPFLLVAAFTGSLMGRIRKLGRIGHLSQIAAGGILVAVGVAMMTGYLSSASTWMLNAFPFFQEILL